MENKPTKKTEVFLHAIRSGYGIEVDTLQFLLRGWGGDCYAAETKKGERYFLKIHDDATYMGTAATLRNFYLPLMDQLNTKRILPHIPHPIKTLDDEFKMGVGSKELVLTNFIEAELVGFGHLPDHILVRLAEAVGVLHNSRAQIEIEHPFTEQFEISFAADLVRSFEKLAAVTAKDSLGTKLLRQTLLPNQGEVLAALQYLNDLKAQVKEIKKPMVICHTDLHGGNLMTDDQGNLYILDWENALIAPPEHDLFFFASDGRFWELFLPAYKRQFGPASIEVDILRFYYYRRTLEDIAGFVLRILQGEGEEARDQEDIGWLQGNLKDLGRIEPTIAEFQKKLKSMC